MTERTSKTSDSMWQWLPFFIGGFCAPLLGIFLNRWLPLHFAVGVAFFIMWFIVGLVYSRMPPNPNWRFGRWIGGGALGAVTVGVIAFFLPWR